MSYSKPDQTPFAANLTDHEVVVQLDSGDYVAVCCACSVEPSSGNAVIKAAARVVDGTGADALDADGGAMKTSFSHTSSPQEASELGIPALQKISMMAVLGESTAPMFQDPIHAVELINWSIRTNIASSAHAGPVTDPGALL